MLANIVYKLKKSDVENIKLVLFFITILGITLFFIVRILDTVNKGLEAQKRTEIIARQVEELENQNKFLKTQKEKALSDSEIEAQYRALGYKKEDEKVYIVIKNGITPTMEATSDPSNHDIQEGNKLYNWERWLIKLFK